MYKTEFWVFKTIKMLTPFPHTHYTRHLPGGYDLQAWHQCIHQQTAHLQLSWAAVCWQRSYGNRTRRLWWNWKIGTCHRYEYVSCNVLMITIILRNIMLSCCTYILKCMPMLFDPGGEIVSTFGKPELVKIGKCDLIQQINIGDETLIKFRWMGLLTHL